MKLLIYTTQKIFHNVLTNVHV